MIGWTGSLRVHRYKLRQPPTPPTPPRPQGAFDDSGVPSLLHPRRTCPRSSPEPSSEVAAEDSAKEFTQGELFARSAHLDSGAPRLHLFGGTFPERYASTAVLARPTMTPPTGCAIHRTMIEILHSVRYLGPKMSHRGRDASRESELVGVGGASNTLSA